MGWVAVAIRSMWVAPLIAGLAVIAACEESGTKSPNGASAETASPQARPLQWRTLGDSTLVTIPKEAEDTELQTAIAKARQTDAEARLRWLNTPEENRDQWFIKWAAPLAETPPDTPDTPDTSTPGASDAHDRPTVEHVWVQPVEWTMFRVEGVLATKPHGELACGKTMGDLVSFPVDELSDWLFLLDGDFTGRREGGYTIEVLEKRFGKPGAN